MNLGKRVAPLLKLGGNPLRIGASLMVRAIRPVATPALYLYAAISPEADRHLLTRPEFEAMFLDDLLNGSRKQLAAPFNDVILFTRDWGFRLDEVKVPVRWWHGDTTTSFRSPMASTSCPCCPTPSCSSCRGKSSGRVGPRRGDPVHADEDLGRAGLTPRRRLVSVTC